MSVIVKDSVSFEMVDSTSDLLFKRVDGCLGVYSFGRVLA